MKRVKLLCLFLVIGIVLLFIPLEKINSTAFHITSEGLDAVSGKSQYFCLIGFDLFKRFNWTCYYAAFLPVILIAYTFLPGRFQSWLFPVFLFVNIAIASCGLFFLQVELDLAHMFDEATRLPGIIILDLILILYILLTLLLFHKRLRQKMFGYFGVTRSSIS